MNRLQKLSWLNLIVIFATITITTIVIMVELEKKGYSDSSLWFFVIPLLSLKLKPFLFNKPEGRDKVVLDERDINITKNALHASIIINENMLQMLVFWFQGKSLGHFK